MRETWSGTPLLGTMKIMYRKALETGISLRRGSAGELGRRLVYWGLKDE